MRILDGVGFHIEFLYIESIVVYLLHWFDREERVARIETLALFIFPSHKTIG
jgi:hypothetical protein